MGFLNNDNGVFTSARADENGNPITDVHIRNGININGDVVSVTLHNESTTAHAGVEFQINNYKALNIKVAGTSTSREVVFEVAGFDGVYEPIQGIKVQDFSMSNKATGNNESWQFDVTGFVTFRARIVTVNGGNVTIKGRAVA